MIVNKPMEHWSSSKICADCVNDKCKNNILGESPMIYSADCERYDCMERLVEERR